MTICKSTNLGLFAYQPTIKHCSNRLTKETSHFQVKLIIFSFSFLIVGTNLNACGCIV